MKKPFSHRRNFDGSNSGGRIVSYAIVFVVVLFILLFRIFLPSTFFSVSAPLWSLGSRMEMSIGNLFSGFSGAQNVAAQNVVLSAQIQTLQNQNAVLTARAQDLTKLLGGQADAESNILAGVLARPPESPYDTLVVDQGSQDGVVVTAPVFATGGIPVGTIESVTGDTSIVQLLSTPNVTTSGWVGDNRIPVTLIGKGAGAFTATLPKTSPVSVGDSAYVPGPGAVPLGTIVRIDTDPSSPTVVIHIQPLVNIFSLTWVEIGRSS